MIPETNVDPFDFTLTVPLQKFYNYVDTSKNIGRGTMPDYPINMTMEDVLKGEDLEMTFAIDLIRKGVRN